MPLISVKQRFATVAGALGYCVRATTPLALGLALFTLFLQSWRVSRLPHWLVTAIHSLGGDVAWKTLLLAFSLTVVSLLSCLPALILTSDEQRISRPLAWCFAINLFALALELYLGFRPLGLTNM